MSFSIWKTNLKVSWFLFPKAETLMGYYDYEGCTGVLQKTYYQGYMHSQLYIKISIDPQDVNLHF